MDSDNICCYAQGQMTSTRLLLPWPPFSLNHTYRAGGGKFWKLPEVHQYSEDVRLVVWEAWGLGARAPDGPLTLRMWLYPPDRRKRDVDGPIKIVLDSLAYALEFDDVRVVRMEVTKCERIPHGGIEIELEGAG